MSELVFWVSLAVIVYTYVVYPVLLSVCAYLFPRPFRAAEITPAVSLIIACHNEEESIQTKLESIANLVYPADQLDVIITMDGCTDATESIVRSWEDFPVNLISLTRSGKAAALGAGVSQAYGDILVFSDANSIFASDAIRQLVRPFADARVGGVAGNQRYLMKNGEKIPETEAEHTYWNYDRLLKDLESRCGNVVSATGALYAIRKEFFRPVPSGVTDDFVISTRVVESGKRLVFATDAVTYEPPAATMTNEFGRKVRLMTRGQRSLWVMRGLLQPYRYGFYSLKLWSHKVLRRILFIPLALLLISNLALIGSDLFFNVFAALQVTCYSLALIGLSNHRAGRSMAKWIAMPSFFLMANAAACIATFNLLRGRQIEKWSPQRSAASA